MYCRTCGKEIAAEAVICVSCGVATNTRSTAPAAPTTPSGAKSRTTFVLLAALAGVFGFPGIHNLYAGYTGKGLTQILVSVLSCWILWLPMLIWAVVEICTVTQDAAGEPFAQ